MMHGETIQNSDYDYRNAADMAPKYQNKADMATNMAPTKKNMALMRQYTAPMKENMAIKSGRHLERRTSLITILPLLLFTNFHKSFSFSTLMTLQLWEKSVRLKN